MLGRLQTALASADRVLALVDTAADRHSSGKDSEVVADSSERVGRLLSNVVVGRTLNMGWLTYVRAVVSYWDSLPPGEPEVMVDQIRANMAAIVEVVDLVSPEPAETLARSDMGIAALRLIARGEDDLVAQVRAARDENRPEAVDRIALDYERLCVALRARGRRLLARPRG